MSNTPAHENKKRLTGKNLIWHLNEEANSIALEDTINESNEAMLVVTAKACDSKVEKVVVRKAKHQNGGLKSKKCKG